MTKIEFAGEIFHGLISKFEVHQCACVVTENY